MDIGKIALRVSIGSMFKRMPNACIEALGSARTKILRTD
jgi:hypothetical protein